MTTVAFDGTMFAADGQMGDGMICDSAHQKLFRVAGLYVGCAGSVVDHTLFRLWLEDLETGMGELVKPEFKEPFTCMVYDDGEIMDFSNSTVPVKMPGPYYAIGSGREYAMGAMHAGATAKEAVKIACRLDPDSGGKIRTMKVRSN